MKPGKLYTSARIQGGDGFIFARYIYKVDEDEFKALMDMLGFKITATMMTNNMIRYYDPRLLQSKFIKYLKTFCADGFCIATQILASQQDDDFAQKMSVLVGFRSQKDLFKFNLRFGAKRIKTWRSDLLFTAILTVDDPYDPRPGGEKWNREDPNGFL